MEAVSKEPDGKFSLVQQLAKDLSAGDLELTSFPDIALRIRKALNDEMCTTAQIVQILGAEPVLAAKILAISNSAALRPAGDAITDLPMAVNRIGRNMVRNAAMSFAIAQTEKGYSLKEAKEYLDKLWDECAHVAALCFTAAIRRNEFGCSRDFHPNRERHRRYPAALPDSPWKSAQSVV